MIRQVKFYVSILFLLGIAIIVCGCLQNTSALQEKSDKDAKTDSQHISATKTDDSSNKDQEDTNTGKEENTKSIKLDSLSKSTSVAAPAAVPVLSPEEAEEANIVAIKHYEAFKKRIEEAEAKQREIADLIGSSKGELGYHLILNETFSKCDMVSVQSKQEADIEEKGWKSRFTGFDLPNGTKLIKISVQGQKGTIIGFNQVSIYQ